MKKSLSFVLISCLFISMRPLMAQETEVVAVEEFMEPQQQIAPEEPAIELQKSVKEQIEIEQKEAKPTAVLSWWRSLRRPTQQDWQKAKSYVNSKYRCLRYGEACSKKERAVLATLAAAVGIAVAGVAWKVKKVREERAEREADERKKREIRVLEEEDSRWWDYAKAGNLVALQRLIKAGIDINIQNRSGNTALMKAAGYGRTEIVRMLLEIPGIYVNIKNDRGFNALRQAADQGHAEIVQMLLAVPGIDVNLKSLGSTVLLSAVGDGHTEIVQMLLAVPGIDVNLQGFHGDTALLSAVGDGRTEIVQMLLDAGADWRIQNDFRQTALDVAINDIFLSGKKDQKDVIKELIKAGADYSAYFENRIVQEAIRELWPPQRLLEREIGM